MLLSYYNRSSLFYYLYRDYNLVIVSNRGIFLVVLLNYFLEFKIRSY